RRGIGHQWAYLPDMAETIAQLIDRADRLPAFAVYHMEGFWDADGMQMAEAINRVVGGKAKIGRKPGVPHPQRHLPEIAHLLDIPHHRNERS
ncbi:hypothetical protein ACEQ6C_39140, partial [Rhizobium ruizarguesonis]